MDVSCPELIARLNRSVEAESIDAITAHVKADLEDLLSRGALVLPDSFRQSKPDTYARRLLHRDPAGRYTAIVMTWGPGQGTPVHDHGGLWCVEGVVEGQIAVTQYDVAAGWRRSVLASRPGDTIIAGLGEAGRLIPPTDSPRHRQRARRPAVADAARLRRRARPSARCSCPRATAGTCRASSALSFHE